MVRGYLTLLLLLVLMGCNPLDLQRNEAMNVEITYWSNEKATPFPNELFIANNGETVFKVRSNQFNTEIPNAGVFRTRFSDVQLLPIVTALKNEEFVRLQVPANMPPGIELRKLSIQEQDKAKIEKFTTSAMQTPPAFQTAEKLALDLVTAARKAPYQTVGLQVNQLPTQFNSGETVNFSITLTNAGSQSFQLPYPGAWEEKSAQAVLKALRSDISLADLRPRHQKFEAFTKSSFSEIKAKKIQGSMVTLSPSDKITFTLQKQFNWDKGSYDVNISCILPLYDAEGKEIIRCDIISKTINMKCL